MSIESNSSAATSSFYALTNTSSTNEAEVLQLLKTADKQTDTQIRIAMIEQVVTMPAFHEQLTYVVSGNALWSLAVDYRTLAETELQNTNLCRNKKSKESITEATELLCLKNAKHYLQQALLHLQAGQVKYSRKRFNTTDFKAFRIQLNEQLHQIDIQLSKHQQEQDDTAQTTTRYPHPQYNRGKSLQLKLHRVSVPSCSRPQARPKSVPLQLRKSVTATMSINPSPSSSGGSISPCEDHMEAMAATLNGNLVDFEKTLSAAIKSHASLQQRQQLLEQLDPLELMSHIKDKHNRTLINKLADSLCRLATLSEQTAQLSERMTPFTQEYTLLLQQHCQQQTTVNKKVKELSVLQRFHQLNHLRATLTIGIIQMRNELARLSQQEYPHSQLLPELDIIQQESHVALNVTNKELEKAKQELTLVTPIQLKVGTADQKNSAINEVLNAIEELSLAMELYKRAASLFPSSTRQRSCMSRSQDIQLQVFELKHLLAALSPSYRFTDDYKSSGSSSEPQYKGTADIPDCIGEISSPATISGTKYTVEEMSRMQQKSIVSGFREAIQQHTIPENDSNTRSQTNESLTMQADRKENQLIKLSQQQKTQLTMQKTTRLFSLAIPAAELDPYFCPALYLNLKHTCKETNRVIRREQLGVKRLRRSYQSLYTSNKGRQGRARSLPAPRL
ncbi:MAG: hypothetical protein ACPGUD_07710 [Parashewanella sp.]